MSWLLDERTELESLGDGRYRRLIDDGEFWGTGSPFGGYLMALGFAAMRHEVTDDARLPRVYTHQFLRRVPVGPLGIEVTTERVGALVHSVTARFVVGDDTVGVATGMFTGDREGPHYLDEPMPAVAPPTEPDPAPVPGWATNVHGRFVPYRRFGEDGAVVPNEDGGWLRMVEPGDWDHRLALMCSDVWPPPVVRHPDRMCATPSLHHVVHFGSDVGGSGDQALLVRHRATRGHGGLTDEDITLWADDGRFLLKARQLRTVIDLSRIDTSSFT
ncbi:MAG: thioesterase family protein [Acidimicrobiales bacterium]|nr:thioesterase family protein [Acidimicrobiales bacterium]